MPRVYFDKEYSSVIKKLYEDKDEVTGQPVFKYLWQLMIFLAMVGRRKKKTCEFVKKLSTDSRTREIQSSYFESERKDGIVYLLALDQMRDGEILREGSENESKIWQYLESFAQIGIEEVDSWLLEYQFLAPKDVLFAKMKEVAKVNIDNIDKVFVKPKF